MVKFGVPSILGAVGVVLIFTGVPMTVIPPFFIGIIILIIGLILLIVGIVLVSRSRRRLSSYPLGNSTYRKTKMIRQPYTFPTTNID